MAKYLIYLGNTGTAYRIALFDDERIVARSIPVKDVQVLPDVPFLNCTVINGVPHPNLMGAKVLCNYGRNTPDDFIVSKRPPIKPFDYKLLWADPKVEPEYFYGKMKFGGNDVAQFYPGWLLSGFTIFTVWDGTCKDSNWYILGTFAQRVSKKSCQLTGSRFCVSGKGELALLDSSDVRLIASCGNCVIQAGTPRLKADLRNITTPAVKLDDDEKRVAWHSMPSKKYTAIEPDNIFAVWHTKDYHSTVYDLRKFKNTKVFGISSVADARTIIFSDSTEEIWAGFTYCAPSLTSVYLPRSVDTIHEFGIPVRRIKKVTFYSDSPVVKEFAERVGSSCVPCSSADDMLTAFYSSTSDDYISIEDAEGIAAIADARSKADGGDGTVMSAVLLSCNDKGFAKEEIEAKYPIVHTCEGNMPPKVKLNSTSPDWKLHTTNHHADDYCRLLIAALTQFYPPCEVPELKDYDHTEYNLGTYTVYLSFLTSASPVPIKPKETDAYVMIEYRPSSKLIHSFACKANHIKAFLHYLSSVRFFGEEPCGVLRYADKLPAMYSYRYSSTASGKSEQTALRKALFVSLFPVLYHTRVAKRQILGIDLHTGNFVTATYTLNDYPQGSRYGGRGQVQYSYWLPLVNRLSDIALHTPEWDSAVALPRYCQFLKSKG